MMARNREGVCSISATSLRVPDSAELDFWKNRLVKLGVEHDDIKERENRKTLAFRDPEGQCLIRIG